MERTIEYTPHGVCSRKIFVTVEDDIVKKVQFVGGCNGNTQGVSALCIGRKLDELIPLLDGIKCGPRDTSCPNELAKAFKELKNS